jgi:hypothetical protein
MAVVQNHIHLDLPGNESGAPENAPTLTFTVKDRSEVYETTISVDRAWDGTSYVSVMGSFATGAPVVYSNMRYTIIADLNELDSLKAMLLRKVKLVDSRHCDNGLDHTSYIRDMVFSEMRYAGPINPLLEKQLVEITLIAI